MDKRSLFMEEWNWEEMSLLVYFMTNETPLKEN